MKLSFESVSSSRASLLELSLESVSSSRASLLESSTNSSPIRQTNICVITQNTMPTIVQRARKRDGRKKPTETKPSARRGFCTARRGFWHRAPRAKSRAPRVLAPRAARKESRTAQVVRRRLCAAGFGTARRAVCAAGCAPLLEKRRVPSPTWTPNDPLRVLKHLYKPPPIEGKVIHSSSIDTLDFSLFSASLDAIFSLKHSL